MRGPSVKLMSRTELGTRSMLATCNMARMPGRIVLRSLRMPWWGKDAVFTGDVHEVGTDAQREQIQMVVDRGHGQANGVDQPGEQFERHTRHPTIL